MRREPIESIEEGSDLVARIDGEPFTGCAYEMGAEGRPRSEVEFLDGLQHGEARDWYPNGQIQGRTEYFKGVRHGVEETWFEGGNMATRARWEYDILVEKATWDSSGTAEEHFSLRDDSPQFATLSALRKAHRSP
jgi:antitoxin component YwqK of YwqJK toxin-antitoxin module